MSSSAGNSSPMFPGPIRFSGSLRASQANLRRSGTSQGLPLKLLGSSHCCLFIHCLQVESSQVESSQTNCLQAGCSSADCPCRGKKASKRTGRVGMGRVHEQGAYSQKGHRWGRMLTVAEEQEVSLSSRLQSSHKQNPHRQGSHRQSPPSSEKVKVLPRSTLCILVHNNIISLMGTGGSIHLAPGRKNPVFPAEAVDALHAMPMYGWVWTK